MRKPSILPTSIIVIICFVLTLILLFSGCTDTKQNETMKPVTFEGGQIVQRIPHNTESFTQGLEIISDNEMAESSGMWGESAVTLYDKTTGDVRAVHQLPDDEFGEGLTRVDNTLIQLTWQNGIAHTYTLPDLTPGPDFQYDGEGWGLCYDSDDNVLWRSDGSDTLTAHDPATFEAVRTLQVHENTQPIAQINELEMVQGKIYANVWYTNDLIAIDPASGAVTARYNLSALVALAEEDNGQAFTKEQVFNGIAYDAQANLFYLTGKQWPYTYVVELKNI